jgi:hypothetical protein
MANDDEKPLGPLTVDGLIASVDRETFDRERALARRSHVNDLLTLEIPHDLADRLWFEGPEANFERLQVAVELYRLLPSYSNLMYWPYDTFDDATQAAHWDAFRSFLADPNEAIGDFAAYRLWVDYFEDPATVERAWREVSDAQEPRRPRLERVVPGSGPVPWDLKERLYRDLVDEGGWHNEVFEALFTSCFDVYGQIDREPARELLARLRHVDVDPRFHTLGRALSDPQLPLAGHLRRKEYERYRNDVRR